MEYDQAGKLVYSLFEPAITASVDEMLMGELKSVSSSNSPENIGYNASLLLGSWFSKVTHIELRDIEKEEIVPHVDHCEKHENGIVKKCVITFTMQDKA